MALSLPVTLQSDSNLGAIEAVRRYFAPTVYTGGWFDSWDPKGTRERDANVFTAEDVLAVTFLSVDVPPRATRSLLQTEAGRFADLLAEIGEDRHLADQDDPPSPSDAAWRLELSLRELPGVGRTIASKLLARKRPKLVPVHDSVIQDVLSTEQGFWVPLWNLLHVDGKALHSRLIDIRVAADLGEEVTPLRILDVLAWMQPTRPSPE